MVRRATALGCLDFCLDFFVRWPLVLYETGCEDVVAKRVTANPAAAATPKVRRGRRLAKTVASLTMCFMSVFRTYSAKFPMFSDAKCACRCSVGKSVIDAA